MFNFATKPPVFSSWKRLANRYNPNLAVAGFAFSHVCRRETIGLEWSQAATNLINSSQEKERNVSEAPKVIEILRTKRLVLRQFCPADADRIRQLVNDKQVAYGTHHIPYPYPEGAAEEWLAEHAEFVRCGQAAVFAVCQKNPQTSSGSEESGQLIGTVGLAIASVDHHAEIGYWFGRDYWGQGFGTEAVIAVLDYGFENLGLNRIFAQHIARNRASGRVLEKAGFSKEGVLRQHARKWGVFEDVICYGMLSKDERPEG